MVINGKRFKKLVLVLAAMLAIEIAASFFSYNTVWNLSDPKFSHIMDWVWYLSMAVYGTIVGIIFIWLEYKAVCWARAETWFILFITACYYAVVIAGICLIVFSELLSIFAWIEEQVSVVIPNARIAWALVLGVYLGILYLCRLWLHVDKKKENG